MRMRTAEWINLCTFAAFMLMAFVCRLSADRRRRALLISSAGILLVFTSISLTRAAPHSASVVRDWLPAPLILFAYWAGGSFVSTPDQRLQRTLMEWDERLLNSARMFRPLSNNLLHAYLEFAYLLCYPLIPAGLAALYWCGLRQQVDDYWSVILPSTYACYLMQPLVGALPPRLAEAEPKNKVDPSTFRRLNLWIHQRASIRFITFPSAHVASTFAASLVLLRLVPVAGVVFLALSLSIAVAAVVERYHYAADVLLGIAVAGAVMLIIGPAIFT